MRYNASELKHIAMTSARLCSKEGILSLKEKEGKLWNKTDVLTERWCRLVDNLLFYFKTKDMTSDPHGIFVLEGSHVRLVRDESQGCAFILEFDGDNRSVYFLASEATEAKEWINVLENASYTKLKQKYESLVNQHEELTGESSQQSLPQPLLARQMAVRETKSANSSPMVLHRNLSQSPDFNMTLSDFDGIPSESRATKKKMKKKKKQKKLQHPGHDAKAERNLYKEPLNQTSTPTVIIVLKDSTLPILEVVLSCSELNIPKAIDHKRQVQINVLSLLPPAADWKTTFNTECQKAADNLGFHLTLSFYQSHLLTPHTQLRFHLCQHKENNTVSSLGCVTCAVGDLFVLTRQLTLEFEKGGIPIGKLHLHVLKEHISPQLRKNSSESQLSTVLLSPSHSSSDILNSPVDSSYGDIGQVPNLKSLYCEAISRTYRFPMSDGKFCSVQEIMLETRLSLHIPHLYLKLLIDQETGYIGTLNSIKFLAERLHLSRTKHIECKTALLQQYHAALKNIVNQKRAISFKPSIHKTDKEFEFEPTNLHMQRMRVQHSDCISALALESTKDPSGTCSAGVYDIITVGAATAHSMKYKQGGLLTLIPTASERLKKGTLISGFSRDDCLKELTELPVTLPDLHKDVNSLVSTLETLFEAGKECSTVPNRKSTESTVFNLSDKTCKLVSLLDNKELCKVLHVLLNHSNGPSSTSSLVNAATSLVSATGLEWEEMKTSVKTKLAEVVKKVHLMMDAADDFLSLRHDYAPPSFDDILTEFKELSSRTTSVVNLAMQGHAIHIMQSTQEPSETIYRRDVVFSQVLSSCVCGVATNLISSLHDALYLVNVAKYGMLIEFESLLSTYKNELRMLEDYVVGVYDLSNVSFCCDRAREQEGDSMDHLLPTLHGTRNKIVVRLHLDPVAFSHLPDSLKSGEHFQVVPVMFNVGINEEQSLSDRIHNTSIQEYLNMDSCSRLKDYCQNWKKSSMRAGIIDERLQKLDEVVHSKKKKNVEILHLSAEICRMFNGVRVTSCKSAKDRTAMSVTLEQVQVLQQNHNLSSTSSSSALNCMRSEGTRRENTRKNVGVRKYAFTGVQLMTFPKQYKPPEGTYGNAKS